MSSNGLQDLLVQLQTVGSVFEQNKPGVREQLLNLSHARELADDLFQIVHHTELPFFAWLNKTHFAFRSSTSYMSAYRAGKPSWGVTAFYLVAERLHGNFDPSVSVVVLDDVGGGLGHDLINLIGKHPSFPGRLVLQDRAEVVSTISGADDRFLRPWHMTSPLRSPFRVRVSTIFTRSP